MIPYFLLPFSYLGSGFSLILWIQAAGLPALPSSDLPFNIPLLLLCFVISPGGFLVDWPGQSGDAWEVGAYQVPAIGMKKAGFHGLR